MPATQTRHVAAAMWGWTLFLLTGLVANAALAQQTLRWQFREGERRAYTLENVVELETRVGEQSTRMLTRQTIHIESTVTSVDAEGRGKLAQRLTRVQITSESPEGTRSVDTDSREAPDAFGSLLAPLLEAITDIDFTLTVTPRGEITNVEVPEGLAESLRNLPQVPGAAQTISSDGIVQLMRQSSLEFPEKAVQPGDAWTSTTKLGTVLLGRQSATRTYTYAGQETVEGRTLERINIRDRVDFAEAMGAVQMKVNEQNSEGHLLFDNERGELVRLETESRYDVEIRRRGNSIQQIIRVRTNLTPQTPLASSP